MSQAAGGGRVVNVHTAGTTVEAMVIRGLLASSGVLTTGSATTDPFPLREVPEGSHGVEIFVLESQAEEARQIIAEYLKQREQPGGSDESGE